MFFLFVVVCGDPGCTNTFCISNKDSVIPRLVYLKRIQESSRQPPPPRGGGVLVVTPLLFKKALWLLSSLRKTVVHPATDCFQILQKCLKWFSLCCATHNYNYFLVSQSRNFGYLIGRVCSRLIRFERRTTKGNSSEYIMHLVPVFILETHNQTIDMFAPFRSDG